jgi:RHS repeat-associated protein
MNRFQSRTDKVNIDRVSDALVPANDEVLTYTDAGRLATAPATDTLRFPGQYYQLEDGLAYNWHRSYDASLGRYTQPDPLGFVDGPSLYGYAGQSPLMMVDPWGLLLLSCRVRMENLDLKPTTPHLVRTTTVCASA